MRNSNRGPAFLILFATLMAAAGDGVSIVAFPWLVLQREGSAGQASIVASATMLPLLFATLVAGTAVDYFGRRRVSMVADALSGAAVAGPQPAHQASAGPPGHPQSRLGDLIRRDVPPSVNRTTRPRRVASPDSQSPIDITDGMS